MLKKLVERKQEDGFTLVELLIVVAIIAILAAIAIPQFQAYRYRAWRGELAADTKNAFTASQAYLSDDPTRTVNSLAMLTASGYRSSANVSYMGANLTISAGSLSFQSNPLVAAGEDNSSSTVDFAGVMVYN